MEALIILVMSMLVIGFAISTLRRTRPLPHPLSARDRLGRTLALILLTVPVAGFGLCGGWGLFGGVTMILGGARDGEMLLLAVLMLVAGLTGLAIAVGAIGALTRNRRRQPAEKANSP
ncbi:MAG: hypothetical protein RLZZ584_944 [Pseudomonadota bacterium]|jgi:hypothetical protein